MSYMSLLKRPDSPLSLPVGQRIEHSTDVRKVTVRVPSWTQKTGDFYLVFLCS